MTHACATRGARLTRVAARFYVWRVLNERGGRVGQRDREWFVEQVGAAAEADGFTRIGGRIFGHLLLSVEPCSLVVLVAELGAC